MNKYADLKCVCGNNNYKKIFSGYFNRCNIKDYYFEILKCKKCKLVRTYPMPDVSNFEENITYASFDDIEKEEKENFWVQPIIRLAKRYIDGGNLLDIGCFAGKLLEEAKREGFNAYGVELYKPAAEYGKDKGRKIFLGQIYDAHFNNSFFSCIVMNHVLEHIPDPIKLIREIDRILKCRGILIVNIPAYNSVMRVIMGQNWMVWTPHIHTFFYTKKTLNDIVTKNSTLKPVFIHQRGRLEPTTNTWFKNKLKDFIANCASLIDKGEQIETLYIKE